MVLTWELVLVLSHLECLTWLQEKDSMNESTLPQWDEEYRSTGHMMLKKLTSVTVYLVQHRLRLTTER